MLLRHNKEVVIFHTVFGWIIGCFPTSLAEYIQEISILLIFDIVSYKCEYLNKMTELFIFFNVNKKQSH